MTSSSRSVRRRRRPWPALTTRAILLWAALMAPLLWWGLPSSRDDELLFGGEPAWPAQRYDSADDLDQLRARDAGADTDLNPILDRDRIVDLTADRAARAEILRRYRLFSRQPDEMIIFRALQRMNPRAGDFDPRLYQYGGGYIYMVGAALGAGSLLGAVPLTGDLGFYLENPEAFARFFVVARLISLVFGALTLVAVVRLARRAGGRRAGWIALLCVAFCPVFLTAVLEAKPHLPSACLILWATLSALDYHARRRLGDAVRMALQAGCAFGLVLTGAVSSLLWPALLIAAPVSARRRTLAHLLVAGILAGATYLVLNPYVPYNWLTDPAALSSNIDNSTAMYQDQISRAPAGAVRVGALLSEAAGFGVPVAGCVGLVLLLRRRRGPTAIAAVAGVGTLLICVLLGGGKPAEFARFLVLPVLLLSSTAAWLLASVSRRHVLLAAVATIAVLATMHTPAYVGSFVRDARGRGESRFLAGGYLRDRLASEDAVGLLQEPAPYAVPPLDFAHRSAWLLPISPPPHGSSRELPRWLVFTADDYKVHRDAWWQAEYRLDARFPPAGTALSPITWADKPVFIFKRRDSAATPPSDQPRPTTAPSAGS